MNKRDSKVLSVLSENIDRWGDVHLSMAKLSELTLLHRDTLSLSVKSLSDQGFISIERTKRNYGKKSWNVYRLLDGTKNLQSVQNPTSTADYGKTMSENTVSETLQSVQNPTSTASQPYLVSTSSVVGKLKDTSYLLPFVGTEGSHKNSGGQMVNRWASEDDEFGFGLLDTPERKSVPSKRKPQTRFERPQAEWTAMDVASEFSSRLYENIKGIPGLVNTRSLGVMLAKNRKEFGLTASVELVLMEKFFADERNITSIRKFPKGSIGIFMNFITNNVAEVSTVTYEEVSTIADEQPALYASDGRKFAKTMTGRKALERYEEKLRNQESSP